MLAGGKIERWLVKVGLLPDRISALLWPTALVLMLPPSPMWQHHTGAVDWGGAQSSLHGSLCAPCDTVFYITKETRNGGEKRQVMVIYDHASHRLSIRSWESYKTCNLSLGRKEVIQPSVSVLYTYRMQNTSKTLYRAKKCFFSFFRGFCAVVSLSSMFPFHCKIRVLGLVRLVHYVGGLNQGSSIVWWRIGQAWWHLGLRR